MVFVPAGRRISSALMASTAIVAYLVLFATVGFVFLFASLLLGKFLRAHAPTPLKLETYECGEPAVGPGSVQFDLRFYVVALVFIIFEVEVAMFFPTATVFGKASQLLSPDLQVVVQRADATAGDEGSRLQLNSTVAQKYTELGVPPSARPSPHGKAGGEVVAQGNTLALASMLDLGVFFAVLLVGFAFVWKRGDLDWVRSVRHPPTPAETAALARRLRGEA
jgi:NADH-quinone oxidoreductase subunit A